MPIVNGKVVRARYTSLKLREISSVDNPAQPGAIGAVVKRMEDPAEAIANILKYVDCNDGAHSFEDVLRENKFSQEIWPFTDALSQSIRSIVGDTSIGTAEREEKINESVEEFLAAVRSISPDVAKSLEGLISKREVTMPKTLDELQKDLDAAIALSTAAEKRAEKAEADRDAAVAAQKAAEEMKDKAEEECEKARKALNDATDEVVKFEGTEVRKSAVGEAQFTLTKTLIERDERHDFEKRATDRWPTLAGSPTTKGRVLKSIEALGDAENETRKEAESLLDSAEKMVRAGFDRLGVGDPNAEPTRKAAIAGFEKRIDEVQKRDDIPRSAAMTKARREFPEEFAAYNENLN